MRSPQATKMGGTTDALRPTDGGCLILEKEYGARNQARTGYESTRAAGTLRHVRAAVVDVDGARTHVRRLGDLRGHRRVGQRLGPGCGHGRDRTDGGCVVCVPLVGALPLREQKAMKKWADAWNRLSWGRD